MKTIGHEFGPRSLRRSLVATRRGFTFYVADPLSSIHEFTPNDPTTNSRLRRLVTIRAISVLATIVACAISCGFSVPVADKETVKDKSPDGKLALRIGQQDGSGYSKVEIVDLSTNEPVFGLGALGHPNEEDAKLVWSADSQRVAFFEPSRRGGLTRVFFRNGTSFQEIELPTLPEPKTPKRVPPNAYDKTITALHEPVRWLKSGALVMYTEVEGDYSGRGALEIIIGFDQTHKPSVMKSRKITPRPVQAKEQ
jgi:hypothetical protein